VFLKKKKKKKKVKLGYLLNFLQNAFFPSFCNQAQKVSSAVLFSYPFTKKKL